MEAGKSGDGAVPARTRCVGVELSLRPAPSLLASSDRTDEPVIYC